MAYKRQQPRCKYCGRFFIPDYRVKDRQKSCKRAECQAKRKRESQRKWVEANPGCFKGRYENTKKWREQHPDRQKTLRPAAAGKIQDEIPAPNPVTTLRIVVPEEWLAGEIQDEIVLAKRCGCGFYVGGRKKAGLIQDEIDLAPETG